MKMTESKKTVSLQELVGSAKELQELKNDKNFKFEPEEGGKDLVFIKEIINDLENNGYVCGGMASTMLNDWKTELQNKEEKTCDDCGFVLGSGGTEIVFGESICKECRDSN